VAFAPDGTPFATGAAAGAIRVHETTTGSVLRTMEGHIAFVAGLAFSSDGQTLYSAGYDATIRSWNYAKGMQKKAIGKAGQSILDFQLTPDRQRLVAGSEDNSVWVFSLTEDGTAPLELKGHAKPVTCVAVHPDGRTVFSGSRDETIRSWDLESGKYTAISPKNVGSVRRLAVSADGETLWSVGESWTETSMVYQYFNWAGNLARLDFGNSFIYPDEKVIDLIWERVPVTLGLNFIVLIIIYVIAIPLGVIAAVKRNTLFDNATSAVLFMLWSMPSFWVATMLIIYFSSERNFNWFESVGLHARNHRDLPFFTYLIDWGNHLVLPVLASVYGGFTVLSRFARTSLLETISQDYIRTARAKGLSERVVVFKHALRNSLITIITLLGNLLPGLIGGSVIIEVIFSIKGMGELGFSAILGRDYPVIMAVTTIGAVLTLLGILVSDLLYSVADPRITTR
jgi:peptide/nickel transport system permease protein